MNFTIFIIYVTFYIKPLAAFCYYKLKTSLIYRLAYTRTYYTPRTFKEVIIYKYYYDVIREKRYNTVIRLRYSYTVTVQLYGYVIRLRYGYVYSYTVTLYGEIFVGHISKHGPYLDSRETVITPLLSL